MPLPVAHSLFGASLLAAKHPKLSSQKYSPLLFAAFLSIAPDFDFALVLLTGNLAWHRGFTHSIAFAVLISLILIFGRGRQRLKESIGYALAFSSHAFLDFVTTKRGGGLELFFPFSAERFKLGLFGLSEIVGQYSLFEVVYSLILEFLIFAPLLIILIWRKRSANINLL